MAKCTELWDGIKIEIKIIKGGKEGGYGKHFMKTKFDTDDNLPINKPLKLNKLTIVVRSSFEENGQFYSKVYLYECLYEL